ncbi:MAG: YebC/PmpR family DNA-binding transcriptional regulator [Longimicrobiaceae bacterium]
MAGHSKWAQIKRKKAVTDQRRAAEWSKLIRELTVAAKLGGGEEGSNPRLRLAVELARAANMPNDNIERAIKKGTGDLEGVDYEEVTYEGYGPAGVAIFIEALTDNANRTVAEVRHILSKYGGNLGQSGSVAWMFERKGEIVFDRARYDEAAVMEAALEAGAEDLDGDDESVSVYTSVPGFQAVRDELLGRGLEWESAELAMIPKATVPVGGSEAGKLFKLLERLEESDDVQKVHSNADLDEQAAGVEG